MVIEQFVTLLFVVTLIPELRRALLRGWGITTVLGTEEYMYTAVVTDSVMLATFEATL
jgi:hypothetical protein